VIEHTKSGSREAEKRGRAKPASGRRVQEDADMYVVSEAGRRQIAGDNIERKKSEQGIGECGMGCYDINAHE
jgi:hypothetical protein